jgi:hypothetical protein
LLPPRALVLLTGLVDNRSKHLLTQARSDHHLTNGKVQ